jgi:hypothetical protein
MKIEIKKYTDGSCENVKGSLPNPQSAQLAIVFGDRDLVADQSFFDSLRSQYPNAHIVGCSTSGNIADTVVDEGSIVVTAIQFERATVAVAHRQIQTPQDSSAIGKSLVQELKQHGNLRHVLILSEGLNVNGSSLATGANEALEDSSSIPITGGLAGDGALFKQTVTLCNGPGVPNQVVAVGFYGDALHTSHGCVHGWESFGVNRTITKSIGNVVYEIDGQPALALYKSYLGEEYASKLPGSGLRFPLMLKNEESGEPVIRTLLSVDEALQTLTFAGDIPEGNVAVLMKTNIDGLIQAAGTAAERAKIHSTEDSLAIAISCVGRRLVLTKLVEEEVCAVQEALGENFYLCGFYSYGELAPNMTQGRCNLHNQTMTITTITE